MSNNPSADIFAEADPIISLIKALTIDQKKIAAAVMLGMDLQEKIFDETTKHST